LEKRHYERGGGPHPCLVRGGWGAKNGAQVPACAGPQGCETRYQKTFCGRGRRRTQKGNNVHTNGNGSLSKYLMERESRKLGGGTRIRTDGLGGGGHTAGTSKPPYKKGPPSTGRRVWGQKTKPHTQGGAINAWLKGATLERHLMKGGLYRTFTYIPPNPPGATPRPRSVKGYSEPLIKGKRGERRKTSADKVERRTSICRGVLKGESVTTYITTWLTGTLGRFIGWRHLRA